MNLVLTAALSSVPIDVATSIVEAAFGVFTQWITAGTADVLLDLARVLETSTAVPFNVSFVGEFALVVKLGGALALPLLLICAIQAILRQDLELLLRAVFVRLPLALLFSGVVVEVVKLAIGVTDDWSIALLSLAGTSVDNYLERMSSGFLVLGSGGGLLPVLVALAGAAAALLVWLELAMRSAAIAVATLFTPLALCGLILPATAHWARRLGETLAALILAKPVIAAVLALSVNSVLAGGSLDALVEGVALLLLAAGAPFALLRLVPAVETGAIGGLEGLARRGAGGAADLATGGYDALADLVRPGAEGDPVRMHPGSPSPSGEELDRGYAETAAEIETVAAHGAPSIVIGNEPPDGPEEQRRGE